MRWEEHQGSWRGYDGRRLVAMAVRYDEPAGWAVFVGGVRVAGGPWVSVEEAQRAAENAHDAT